MNEDNRPFVLSIAGFDPCGGAGILADIKTFEQHKVQGLAVCSALTYQHESFFGGLHWVDLAEIQSQLLPLLEIYRIEYIKIGLIQSLSVLIELIEWLKSHIAEPKIIWDPILKASAGYDFHRDVPRNELDSLLSELYLITPNMMEAEYLFGIKEEDDSRLSEIVEQFQVNVLLKGGHRVNRSETIQDELFMPGARMVFSGDKFQGCSKHGTGCILSSAITALLSRGCTLEQACSQAKKYTEQRMQSNEGFLAYHYE